jgi:DNA-directed RNA polymerase I subunit RPA1
MNNKFLDKFRFLERNHSIVMGKSKPIIDSGVLQIEPIEKAKKEIRHEAKVIYSKQKSMGQEKAKEQALL